MFFLAFFTFYTFNNRVVDTLHLIDFNTATSTKQLPGCVNYDVHADDDDDDDDSGDNDVHIQSASLIKYKALSTTATISL